MLFCPAAVVVVAIYHVLVPSHAIYIDDQLSVHAWTENNPICDRMYKMYIGKRDVVLHLIDPVLPDYDRVQVD